MGQQTGIGIVGLGMIAGQYLDTLARFPDVEVVAVADLDSSRARSVADRLSGARALTVDELMHDPEVQIVLDLAIPEAHADIALDAIAQGKHVFSEKPLATTFADGRRLMAAAAEAGLRVGCAPDTVLGTGMQTALAAVADGLIGQPTSALAAFVTPGHEAWHESPAFYYRRGGGPLLDMGPYYVTSLVLLLGSVVSVTATANRRLATRTIAAGPRRGEEFPVEVPTHVSGVLEHESGALTTILLSFDAPVTSASPIEVHGTTGTIVTSDPNRFVGDVSIRRSRRDDEWRTLDVMGGYAEAGRGIGLVDFVRTPHGGAPRASGDLALHVLDVLESLARAAESEARERTSTLAPTTSLVGTVS